MQADTDIREDQIFDMGAWLDEEGTGAPAEKDIPAEIDKEYPGGVEQFLIDYR